MDKFFEYVRERNTALLNEAEKLKSEDRIDESNLAKVRANIYEVCGTVCGVHMKRPGGGIEACRMQLEKFRAIWGADRDKAAAHGDAEKTLIGDIKLETLEDAARKFEEAVK